MKRKNTLFIIMAMLAVLSAKAQETQTVFNFLKIPNSAHAAALGGDNISVIEDDASLALSNPALLSSVSHQTISLGYMNYMSGTGLFTAGYTHMLSEKATLGGAAQYVNYGSMKQTDSEGRDLGTFNCSDLVLQGIFSYTLAKNLVGGITAKFIYSKLASYTSTAMAVDLGVNYYHPDYDFSISLTARNLGGQLSAYNDNFENLPIDILLGATKRFENTPLQVSLTFSDLNHLNYAFLRHASVGVDLILTEQFYLAAGYNLRRAHDMKVQNTDGSSSSHGAGFSFGGGLLLEKFKLNVSYGKYHLSSSSLMFNASYTL
jgi:long-subunit fatty acid transport protein